MPLKLFTRGKNNTAIFKSALFSVRLTGGIRETQNIDYDLRGDAHGGADRHARWLRAKKRRRQPRA